MDDQWGVDAFDLEAYLRRIGASADADLAAIHRAHLASIPFENLDVMLGRGVSVALPDVAAKIVGAGRGGYCYEHALLLGAALERRVRRRPAAGPHRRPGRAAAPAVAPRAAGPAA